jgi:hypothetical protein
MRFLGDFFSDNFFFMARVVQKWRVSKQQEMVTKKNDKLRGYPLSSVTYEIWGSIHLNGRPFLYYAKSRLCCFKGTSLVKTKKLFYYIFPLLLFFIISIDIMN